MIVIGLTGGIASGKSSISAALAERGVTIIDADKVGHEVYRPGTDVWRQIVDAFGADVVAPNGEINRKALGTVVFSDAAQRRKLEQIVWPAIHREIARRLAELREQKTCDAVIEAAVLVEAGWFNLMDQIWVVSVPEDAAVQRLTDRNGLTEQQARARLAAQLTNTDREARADVVIDNSGLLKETLDLVNALWDELVATRCGRSKVGVVR